MGTQRQGFRWQGSVAPMVCACLSIADVSAQDSPAHAGLIVNVATKARPVRQAPWALPVSAADVVRYFTRTLDVPPRRGDQGGTVFESTNVRPEEQYRIMVFQEEGEVVVSFAVGGDYGMNIAREFFECPLFQRSESEQLYALLNQAETGPTVKMKRFSVSARGWETRDRSHLVLRFFRPEGPVSL